MKAHEELKVPAKPRPKGWGSYFGYNPSYQPAQEYGVGIIFRPTRLA
jgi:hypothetical protein